MDHVKSGIKAQTTGPFKPQRILTFSQNNFRKFMDSAQLPAPRKSGDPVFVELFYDYPPFRPIQLQKNRDTHLITYQVMYLSAFLSFSAANSAGVHEGKRKAIR